MPLIGVGLISSTRTELPVLAEIAALNCPATFSETPSAKDVVQTVSKAAATAAGRAVRTRLAHERREGWVGMGALYAALLGHSSVKRSIHTERFTLDFWNFF